MLIEHHLCVLDHVYEIHIQCSHCLTRVCMRQSGTPSTFPLPVLTINPFGAKYSANIRDIPLHIHLFFIFFIFKSVNFLTDQRKHFKEHTELVKNLECESVAELLGDWSAFKNLTSSISQKCLLYLKVELERYVIFSKQQVRMVSNLVLFYHSP